MTFNELPPDIQKIARSRIIPALSDGTYDNQDITGLFVFENTPEGDDIWRSVQKGNYKPFYDFHKMTGQPNYYEIY